MYFLLALLLWVIQILLPGVIFWNLQSKLIRFKDTNDSITSIKKQGAK
jgi:hypothetical protein